MLSLHFGVGGRVKVMAHIIWENVMLEAQKKLGKAAQDMCGQFLGSPGSEEEGL